MTETPQPITPEEHQLIDELMSELIGIHFPENKRELLEAKLRPRLQQLHLQRYMDYFLRLQYDLEQELKMLAELVTNNETYFFRETYQFQALFEDAARGLIEDAVSPGSLRFLCAGCSSGEEPYTLKIYSGQHAIELGGAQCVIDAFDLDAHRLEMAETGEYGPSSLRAASEPQIRTNFVRVGADRYALQPLHREGVIFSHGNILEPATYPSSQLYDCLFCRNVLIYFSEPALRRAIANFAQFLRPGGLLFLGHSESIIGMSNEFEPVRLKRCIAYKRV